MAADVESYKPIAPEYADNIKRTRAHDGDEWLIHFPPETISSAYPLLPQEFPSLPSLLK